MSRRSGQNGSIEKRNGWYCVRYWKDVEGQEERVRMREKICPASGPCKLSASDRERKAKEIITASGVDAVQYFERVVVQTKQDAVTFREQAEKWLEVMRNRKRDPLAPSTLSNWKYCLDKWINPKLGDTPLNSVNNSIVRDKLVNAMVEGKLSPKSIKSYLQVVKMVVGSAVNEDGEPLYPRKWNDRLMDVPAVSKKKQRRPSVSGEVVTQILAATMKEKYRILFALCAGAGLRFGEALGIDLANISPDFTNIKITEKAWRMERQNFLKTEAGEREIDLHSSLAKMLREYVERKEKKTGLLFHSKSGRPLHQSNILRRTLHPILESINQPKCGAHAFRRFRNTHLRNYTSCPEGIRKFWMGWSGDEGSDGGWKSEGMSDLYDMIRENASYRKEQAEKAGLGFKIPSKKAVVGPNGPRLSYIKVEPLAVSA